MNFSETMEAKREWSRILKELREHITNLETYIQWENFSDKQKLS